MKNLTLCLWLCMVALVGKGQILTSDPLFPTQDDAITIYYNTTSGNGALAGFTPPLFAHTGVITNLSTSNSDWRHVQGNWGTSDGNVLLTYVSPNLYSFTIPNLSTYYGLQAGETVSRLMFVFRNTSGSTVGRNADGSDIYLELYPSGFNAAIIQPGLTSQVVTANTEVAVQCASNQNATITLTVNGQQVAQQTNTQSLNYTFSSAESGQFDLEMTADNGTEVRTETTRIIVAPTPEPVNPPAGSRDGITIAADGRVTFQLYAPGKDYVFLIGDFNDWQLDINYLMNRNVAGDTYWMELTGLNPNTEYRFQYYIDDIGMRIADPYSEKVLDMWNDPWIPETTYPNLIDYPTGLTTEPVSTFKINDTPFTWTDQAYVRPPQNRLVVYELLVRDFLQERSWDVLRDTLDYLENLGVRAVQLMPFNEFEGNDSWGYNPSFFFAPDKAYGTKNALKAFINECHMRGIAVIQDIALNHSFGQNPMVRMYFDPEAGEFGQPTPESPWFNPVARHPFNVGYDFNHESARTRTFCKRVLEYWIEEFHIDGYRLDLSKGFTQVNSGNNIAAWNAYDQSRINILTDYYSHIQSVENGAYVILEHLGVNSEETVLSNNGMMLWGKMTTEYEQAAMGYSSNSDLSWGNYQARGWADQHLVSYAESHDEERVMYKCLNFGNSAGGYDTQDLNTALKRAELVHTFLIPIPGPKMIWQFGEIGYDYSINYCPNNGSINESCRVDAKPVRWDYMENANRLYLYKVVSALNNLKKTQPVFSTTNFTANLGGFGKRLILNHASMNAVVNGNFDVVGLNMVPGFQHTGTWYDYFSNTTIEVTDLNASFYYAPGEYRLYTDQPLEAPDLSTSVEEVMNFFKKDMVVYPNPTEDQVTLAFQVTQAGKVQVTIYDLTGRVVMQETPKNCGVGIHSMVLNMRESGLTNGTYLVNVVSEGNSYTEQLIVTGN